MKKKKNKAKLKPIPKAKLTSKYEAPELKDDKFWDKKAYKQCLWNYFLQVKRGRLMTERDVEKVWFTFNQVAKDAEARFHRTRKELPSEVKAAPPRPGTDYIARLIDGLKRRGITFSDSGRTQAALDRLMGREAMLNYVNAFRRGMAQKEAQTFISLVLRAEAESKKTNEQDRKA